MEGMSPTLQPRPNQGLLSTTSEAQTGLLEEAMKSEIAGVVRGINNTKLSVEIITSWNMQQNRWRLCFQLVLMVISIYSNRMFSTGLGFDEDLVREVIRTKIQTHGDVYQTAERLFKAVDEAQR